MKKVEHLLLPNGHAPFTEWLDSLDIRARANVVRYVRRVSAGGSKKNVKALGNCVFEIKIDVGPGYRVYFGEIGREVLVFILGGIKRSQERDISKAKEYWRFYVPNNFF